MKCYYQFHSTPLLYCEGMRAGYIRMMDFKFLTHALVTSLFVGTDGPPCQIFFWDFFWVKYFLFVFAIKIFLSLNQP